MPKPGAASARLALTIRLNCVSTASLRMSYTVMVTVSIGCEIDCGTRLHDGRQPCRSGRDHEIETAIGAGDHAEIEQPCYGRIADGGEECRRRSARRRDLAGHRGKRNHTGQWQGSAIRSG